MCLMLSLFLGLIERFYCNLLIKGPEAQKQRPYELLLMLGFDDKSISKAFNSNILEIKAILEFAFILT